MDAHIEKCRRRDSDKADGCYDIRIEVNKDTESEKAYNLINTLVEYTKSLEDVYSYARCFELPF